MSTKCAHCSYSYGKEVLNEYKPLGLMLCDDCLEYYLSFDLIEEGVDSEKVGLPVEQYFMGWKIVPVLKCGDGRHDFKIYEPITDKCHIKPYTTVEVLRKYIEEMESETVCESEPDFNAPNQNERDEQHFNYQRLK